MMSHLQQIGVWSFVSISSFSIRRCESPTSSADVCAVLHMQDQRLVVLGRIVGRHSRFGIQHADVNAAVIEAVARS